MGSDTFDASRGDSGESTTVPCLPEAPDQAFNVLPVAYAARTVLLEAFTTSLERD
jgi:hypothetical protein